MVEHVAQEAHVLRAAAPDDDLRVAGTHSASAGRSTSATSVWRNVAPSAPSIARWSQVSIMFTIGRDDDLPVADDQPRP